MRGGGLVLMLRCLFAAELLLCTFACLTYDGSCTAETIMRLLMRPYSIADLMFMHRGNLEPARLEILRQLSCPSPLNTSSDVGQESDIIQRFVRLRDASIFCTRCSLHLSNRIAQLGL